MATSESIPKNHLRVSSYDRVSSWLVSALVVVGVTVAALVFIYFTRQLLEEHFSVPVTPVGSGGGGTGGISDPTGTGQDLEPPGTEEAPDLTEPQLQDTLSAVATAVSSRSALIADENIDAIMEPALATAVAPAVAAAKGAASAAALAPGLAAAAAAVPKPNEKSDTNRKTSTSMPSGSTTTRSSLPCWILRTTRSITLII
jgi:cytoskeletal protein RodZ